jgi:hypothetical protein
MTAQESRSAMPPACPSGAFNTDLDIRPANSARLMQFPSLHGLRNVFSLADLKMGRLLDTFDEWARTHGHGAEVGPPERFPPTRVPESTRLQLDLKSHSCPGVNAATA